MEGLQQTLRSEVTVVWHPNLDPSEPRLFEWDVTSYLDSDGDYFLQVRRDNGQNGVLVRSIALLEDGTVIGRDDYAAEVNSYIDTKVTWLTLGKRKSDSRYTIRVILQGTKRGEKPGVCGFGKEKNEHRQANW